MGKEHREDEGIESGLDNLQYSVNDLKTKPHKTTTQEQKKGPSARKEHFLLMSIRVGGL